MKTMRSDPESSDGATKSSILLPECTGEGEYVLVGWNIVNGALVRKGDTVALARLKESGDMSESDTMVAEAPVASSTHKRPSRRKRPVAATAAAGANRSQDVTLGKDHVPLAMPQLSTVSILESRKAPARDKNDDSKKQSTIPIAAPSTGFLRIGSKGETEDNSRCIGSIDACAHPAVVDGLCVVCGLSIPSDSPTSSTEQDQSTGGKHPTSQAMSQLTVSGGLTFAVSKQEGMRMGKQNTERLRTQRKLSLILDLDATLVHATSDQRAQKHFDDRDDVRSLLLPMFEEGPRQLCSQHFVKLRPLIREFFQAVMNNYQIEIYTAGVREYAEQVAIALCRYIVGAKRDQLQLQQLRDKVLQAETRLRTQQEQRKDNQKDITNDTSKDNDGEPPPKKRRVTFSSDISIETTEEEVKQLKEELQTAEEIENEALKMRQRVFGTRITTRTEVWDLGRDVKSLRRICPCGGTMAAVVDDREEVWANAQDNNTDPNSGVSTRPGEPPENLLLVKPYHWQPFVGFADINNAAGVDLTKDLDNTDDEADVQLNWTADILNRLHDRYYRQKGGEAAMKTVPELLRDMRREVLGGKTIVLSGLVDLNRQAQESPGPRQLLVRYVESLGGILAPAVEPWTSFVIAAKDGTDKVLVARRTPGCLVVKLSWLMECYRSISYRDPTPHLLAASGRERREGKHVTRVADALQTIRAAATKIKGDGGESEDEDDDDDLAAEFEKDLF
jgi:NLI interacting factor-like phosphatase